MRFMNERWDDGVSMETTREPRHPDAFTLGGILSQFDLAAPPISKLLTPIHI